MVDFIEIFRKCSTYIEIVAYLVALGTFFLPFKNISQIVEKSYGKRNSVLDLYNKEQASTEIEKYNMETGNLLFIQYWLGVIVLVLTVISTIVVAINKFAEKIIEKLKNKFSNEIIADIVVEVVPLIFSIISITLTFLSIGNGALTEVAKVYNAQIKMSIGFYLLIIALILAVVVRIVYIVLFKMFNTFSHKVLYVEQTDEFV